MLTVVRAQVRIDSDRTARGSALFSRAGSHWNVRPPEKYASTKSPRSGATVSSMWSCRRLSRWPCTGWDFLSVVMVSFEAVTQTCVQRCARPLGWWYGGFCGIHP